MWGFANLAFTAALVAHADTVMYSANNSGKNRFSRKSLHEDWQDWAR